jgi:hypothetical protein
LCRRKILKRRIVEEGSSSIAQDGGAAHEANKQPHGGIPLLQPYEGSMSNASMGEWGSHATTSSTIHVPHEVFLVLHPTNARRRDRKHHLLIWSPSPLEQFRGEPAQSQYKQGYNVPDHQYQPLENKGRRRKRRKQ